MREIQTSTIIRAPVEKIWSVLTDFSAYPTWNPFIRNIEGVFRADEQLTVTIQPPNQKTMIFRPKILSIDQYAFSWMGVMGLPAIFKGVHYFTLLPESNNTIRFLHSEKFSGLLHIPFFSMIGASTRSGFEKMNQALKERCELIETVLLDRR